jgi:hypothetical protein
MPWIDIGADGSSALLGSPPLRRLLVTSRPSRDVTNDRLAAFCFVPSNGFGNAMNVEVVRSADLLAEFV